MEHDDVHDVLSFVNEPRPEPLAPRRPRRGSANWLGLAGPVVACAVVGAGVLNYYGIVKIAGLERLAKDQPPALAVAPATPTTPAPAVPTPATPPAVPTPPRPRTAPVRIAQEEFVEVPLRNEAAPPAPVIVVDHATPAGRLEAKGLTVAGNTFILADREGAILTSFKLYGPKLQQALGKSGALYEVEARLSVIKLAEQIKSGMQLDNTDLNIAMDSVYHGCGPRVNWLNSDQKAWYYQLMSNRQSESNLNRMIHGLRLELDNLPNRNRAATDFNGAFAAGQASYRGLVANLSAIGSAYTQLKEDSAVAADIAAFNQQANASKKLGPSESLTGVYKRIKEHQVYFGAN